MTFRVTMKTPDALEEAISSLFPNNPDEKDEETMNKILFDELQARKLADKFFKYEEYITIEFDTERETAVVVPVKGQ